MNRNFNMTNKQNRNGAQIKRPHQIEQILSDSKVKSVVNSKKFIKDKH